MKLVLIAVVGTLSMGVASAAPFATPDSGVAVGQAYVYSVTGSGGTAEKFFEIPSPPDGFYMASYAADFQSLGTPTAPVEFACALIKDSKTFLVHSTVVDTGGFAPGVTGQAPVLIKKGTSLEVFCGISANKKWKWNFVPLKVTLVKAAGETTGTLKPTASPG